MWSNVVKELMARLVVDDGGQDLIEYALLTAFIGLAGAAAFTLVASSMSTAYSSWGTGINNLWEPADPV